MSIGLGTAAIGRPLYINLRTKDNNTENFQLEAFKEKGIQLIRKAYSEGVRHFDTAPGYGVAEDILLDWISRDNPTDISVSTKWGYTYVANFDPNAELHEVKEHSLEKLNEQWEHSRLLLPHLKIYQIHSATLDSGVLDNEVILERLFELKKEFKIQIGISVSGANQNEIIEKALSIEFNNELLFDCFQVTFNVFDQSLLLIVDQIKRRNKKIIIKEALANGRIFPNDKYRNYSKTYHKLRALANKYKIGVDAIAIRFCMDMISPLSVLSGASEEPQLLTNLEALKVKLSSDDLTSLKDLAVETEAYWTERKKLGWT